MNSKILVSGSVAYDRIMDFPGLFREHIVPEKLHVLNVSFAVQAYRESFGGTAGNIAYSLALLNDRPTVLASVGTDFGAYETHLRAKNIDLSLVRRSVKKATATATIITDRDDNQITGFYPGALFDAINTATIPRQAQYAIVAPGNLKDMARLPRIFKKSRTPYVFDPGQQTVRLSSVELLAGMKGASVLIGNDYEIALIQQKAKITLAGMLKLVDAVITTLGAKGSLIETAKGQIRIAPTKPKRIVDPTGAGDAYRSGLLHGLTRGWTLKKSAQLGSVVAVHAVECYGTQAHKFNLKTINQRYKNTFHETL